MKISEIDFRDIGRVQRVARTAYENISIAYIQSATGRPGRIISQMRAGTPTPIFPSTQVDRLNNRDTYNLL